MIVDSAPATEYRGFARLSQIKNESPELKLRAEEIKAAGKRSGRRVETWFLTFVSKVVLATGSSSSQRVLLGKKKSGFYAPR